MHLKKELKMKVYSLPTNYETNSFKGLSACRYSKKFCSGTLRIPMPRTKFTKEATEFILRQMTFGGMSKPQRNNFCRLYHAVKNLGVNGTVSSAQDAGSVNLTYSLPQTYTQALKPIKAEVKTGNPKNAIEGITKFFIRILNASTHSRAHIDSEIAKVAN